VRVSVVSGSGKVLMFGSRIDNRTGDPSTVEMTTKPGGASSTGVFDGIVLTSDGEYIDGGVELAIATGGITSYSGLAGLPCGSTLSYVTDFFKTPSSPIAIASDGTFSDQVTLTYKDGATTLFSITWTFSGTLASGVLTGNLRSNTSGGTGDNAACNAIVDRAWRAGWTGSS
jgi:hypothetical protein